MNENKPIIAERIKNLRKEKRLTQEQLAEILGLNAKSSIANYESGANSPSDEVKKKMCDFFGCSMDYLMGITSNKKPKELLEKKLNKLQINEVELKFLKDLFQKNSAIDISLYYLNEVSNLTPSNKREIQILDAVLEVALDYIPEINNNVGTKEEEIELNKMIENNLLSIKSLINSLDASKILQNSSISNKYYMCPVYGQIPAGEPNWVEQCLDGYLPIDPNLMNIINPEECFFLKVNGESMNKVIKNGAFALIRKTNWVENGEIAVVLVNGFDATLKKFTKQGDLVILEPMSDDPSFTTQVYSKNTDVKIIGKYIGKMEMN